MLRSLLIGLGLIAARLLDCNAQADYEDVWTAGDATAPIGSGAATDFETDVTAQGPEGAGDGGDYRESATDTTSEDTEIRASGAGRTAVDCGEFGDEAHRGIIAASNPHCIVPGYVFKPEFDRYGGDIYQTPGVEGPRDVRKFCERELGCAAFNWPWGIIKTVGVNVSDPSSFDSTGAAQRDDLSEAFCHGLYIRAAGPVRRVELMCPNVTASKTGDAAFGFIRRSFDTDPKNCTADREDAVVLPSQIECTHPPGTKFFDKATSVRCMWLESTSISCTFVVTRDLLCSKRKIAAFGVSIAVIVVMGAVCIYVLGVRTMTRRGVACVSSAIALGGHACAINSDPESGDKAQTAHEEGATKERGRRRVRDDLAQATTVVSVLAASVVAALQATEGCNLT